VHGSTTQCQCSAKHAVAMRALAKPMARIFFTPFTWFPSCCAASIWRPFTPPDETEPPPYKAGYALSFIVHKLLVADFCTWVDSNCADHAPSNANIPGMTPIFISGRPICLHRVESQKLPWVVTCQCLPPGWSRSAGLLAGPPVHRTNSAAV